MGSVKNDTNKIVELVVLLQDYLTYQNNFPPKTASERAEVFEVGTRMQHSILRHMILLHEAMMDDLLSIACPPGKPFEPEHN